MMSSYNSSDTLPRPEVAVLTSTSRAEDTAAPQCLLKRVTGRLQFLRRSNASKRVYKPLPPPTEERLHASLNERPIDIATTTRLDLSAAEEKGKTILYLAYGSNLCNETFRGRRGIRPLAQINVLVPELRMTFDLPGIPYTEPCFANTELRDPEGDNVGKAKKSPYHKDRWHKGMVGCVYEVTPSDYAHIIGTEGGGTSYQDVMVTCYPLPAGETVPDAPGELLPFKAHTLFAPAASETSCALKTTQRLIRPDPAYAQPSSRYLKLITDGADELKLPTEYKEYLHQIRPYTITTRRQSIGQALFVATWIPFLMFLINISKKFQDDKGRNPKWLAQLTGMLFLSLWFSYDHVYKKVFGDGERTVGLDDDDDAMEAEEKKPVRGHRRQGSWLGGAEERENSMA